MLSKFICLILGRNSTHHSIEGENVKFDFWFYTLFVVVGIVCVVLLQGCFIKKFILDVDLN